MEIDYFFFFLKGYVEGNVMSFFRDVFNCLVIIFGFLKIGLIIFMKVWKFGW